MCSMRASAPHFARALAERIGEVLPPPLVIHARGGGLAVYADGKEVGGALSPAIIEDEDGRSIAEKAEAVARTALGTIQNDVSEYLTLPWPKNAAGEMVVPGARAGSGRLYLWYGTSESDAALSLGSIDFAEFML
jgi:hypothetical protein